MLTAKNKSWYNNALMSSKSCLLLYREKYFSFEASSKSKVCKLRYVWGGEKWWCWGLRYIWGSKKRQHLRPSLYCSAITVYCTEYRLRIVGGALTYLMLAWYLWNTSSPGYKSYYATGLSHRNIPKVLPGPTHTYINVDSQIPKDKEEFEPTIHDSPQHTVD